MKARSGTVGLLYTAPALLFVAVFVLYPLVQLFLTSLTNASLLGGSEYIGWRNYLRAWRDATFWRALIFTCQYTLFITPILMILGYALALLTLGATRLGKFTRAVVFLPVVIGLGSSSFLWFWLFDEQVGLINKLVTDLGLIAQPVVWFVDADLGLWAVIVSIVWKVVGFGMILFVASLQSISEDVNEAALIDGASYWRRIFHIALPLTSRTIFLTTLVSAIGSMLAFDQFYIMTAGGPESETFTSLYWIYQNSFIYFKQGYGATLSVILMAIILAASALQLLLMRRGDKA
ncbi:MAG TPA: sugar ABC transporter permease [Roseiarcus sp.]|jgi:multiple sugar transport system permease protein|nr:sugar ABC transporter permease [Roseiarcus sp.]